MKIYMIPISRPEPYKWKRELKHPQVKIAGMKAYKKGNLDEIASYALSKRLTNYRGG